MERTPHHANKHNNGYSPADFRDETAGVELTGPGGREQYWRLENVENGEQERRETWRRGRRRGIVFLCPSPTPPPPSPTRIQGVSHTYPSLVNKHPRIAVTAVSAAAHFVDTFRRFIQP